MDDFLQKLKKVVRIVLYGPAISQSDCMKAGPYQLQYNNSCCESSYVFVRYTFGGGVCVCVCVCVWAGGGGGGRLRR